MGSWHRPKPKPPAPQPRATFAVVVRSEDHAIPNALVILSLGVSGSTNQDGYLAFEVPTGDLSYSVHAGGYDDLFSHVVHLTGNLEVPVELIRLVPPEMHVPRVVIRGHFFALETGEPWTMIECSDFNLLNRFVQGEDITPILAQRREVGFNTLRVWTAYDVPGIGTLKPSAPLYTAIPEFLRRLEAFGLYAEMTAFTGPYTTLFASEDQKVAHWESLIIAVAHASNVFLELVNEGDHPANCDLPFIRLREPTDLLCSHGSGTADAPPIVPLWTYGGYHTNDLNEWQRKVGHNAMELADLYHVPIVSNENTRFPDRDDSPQHASDAAAAGALLPAGSCYHSVRGKTSELWEGRELECAFAWTAGALSVPLAFQQGTYHHLPQLESPGVLRVYDRSLPDGRAFIVRIRA